MRKKIEDDVLCLTIFLSFLPTWMDLPERLKWISIDFKLENVSLQLGQVNSPKSEVNKKVIFGNH